MTPRLQAAAMALFAATAAHAETSPWYVGVAQGFTHTSNVRLFPEGRPAESATISSTTLLGGLDQPFGRQRLTAAASVRQLGYSGHSDLNNLGYDLSAGLDWATVERLSGRISLASDRQLNLRTDQPCSVDANGQKSLQSNTSADAQVRLGVVTALTLEGSLGWREQRNSLNAYDCQDMQGQTVSVGARYRFSGALSAGAALRHARYDFPRAVGGANVTTTNNVDFTTTWVASGVSTLEARLSLGRRSDTSSVARDFSGATGSLNWRWQPSGKVGVTTSLERDTGAETFGQKGTVRSDNSRLSTNFNTRVDYAVTGKVAAHATLRHADRDLVDPGVAAGSDKTTTFGLGLIWAPTRSVSTGCDLTQEQRRSTYATSLPYKVDTFGCYGQLVLQ